MASYVKGTTTGIYSDRAYVTHFRFALTLIHVSFTISSLFSASVQKNEVNIRIKDQLRSIASPVKQKMHSNSICE